MDYDFGFEDHIDVDTFVADADIDFDDDVLTLPEDDLFEE